MMRVMGMAIALSTSALVPSAPARRLPRVPGAARGPKATPWCGGGVPYGSPRRGPGRFAAASVALRDSAGSENSIAELAERVADMGAADLGVLSKMEELRSAKFFSLYSVDMLANCAYLKDGLDECEFDACEVLPEEPAPERLYGRDLDEREFNLDSWARMDPPSEDYYNLESYPEGYTGYDGAHVWKFAYEKLCFAGCAGSRSPALDDDEAANGWRGVFDRSVSGLHASIACHIVDDFSEDDAECLAEYDRRVGDHPERPRNLHFAFALVLTALAEARPALTSFVFDAGDAENDARLRGKVQALCAEGLLDAPELAKMAPLMRSAAVTANECMLAESPDGESSWLEEAGIWQMRQRSRAMLRVMDCVQCGACRIHGKVAWFGIATALKVIYDKVSDASPLSRVEVAALLTTLAKLGTAVRFAEEMDTLREELADE